MAVLARHYGFTEEGLESIINDDAKYCVRRDAERKED